MYLTKPQWEAIRQIAAEQARKVINEEHDVNPSWVEALNYGFDPSQLTEVGRIAGATARKTIKQHAQRDQCLQEAYKNLDVLRSQVRNLLAEQLDHAPKLECAVAQNVRLIEENTRLYADLEELRTRLWKQSSANRQTATSARLDPNQPSEGDKWVDMTGQETFTFFRGEWRRQSELEGFASAAKYL